ncbi:PepSY-associated TM helix domain-containing protein [Natronospira bacteriovora]|uniref:PepSY-associated TM helix domain-containing protein n=1 Tax=Natronospira bacteriovora TaxID=3069753 RepID=A0ABU0W8G9_9GAMM|nr:PepSY-associated TM helix domain-containing protein [Natronospira sp. AB-CW4]MDQ2070306.1 PepSY-associated TM helix domain-containing protein [Natronospira sp. AB-CW4]
MRLLYRVHLWVALSLGALFVLIGLSGCLLVYQSTLDRWLNPDLLRAGTASGTAVSATEALASVEALTGESEVVSFLSLPAASRDVYRFYVGTPERTFDRLVTVDPASGRALGERPVGEGIMRFVHVLHFRLHLGRSGQTLIGFTGLFLLFSMITGSLLWWRRRHLRLRQQPLHHGLGVYAGLPLLVVVVTGVMLALPQYTRPAVERFSPLSGLGLGHQSTVPEGNHSATDIGLSGAMSLARLHMPDGVTGSVGLPRSPEGIYRISMREADPAGWLAGSGHLVLDRYSGEILERRHWSQTSGGDRFMAWLRPLHDGRALGQPGRLLVATLGMLPLLLYVTGIRLWLRRRQSA